MKKSIEEFVKYVKKRAYNLDVRYANGQNRVFVSVDFFTEGHKDRIISYKSRKWLSQLEHRIDLDKPQRVEVIIHINDVEELHRYELIEKVNAVNEPKRDNPNFYEPMRGFNGFSSENIEAVVNKRLEEERRERMLQELKTKLNEYGDTIKQKDTEITTLKGDIETKNQELEQLEKRIENKANFKYYAGLTGDILQSFGIKKEIIGKPLAGLLAGDDEDNTPALEQGSTATESTEQVSTFTKRDEMINLLYQYIESIEETTLEKVFEVFSEIESKPSRADQILEFIKTNK